MCTFPKAVRQALDALGQGVPAYNVWWAWLNLSGKSTHFFTSCVPK